MPSPDEIFDNIANDLCLNADTKHGKMFGTPCLKVNGKAFATFHKADMTFKLHGDAHAQAMSIEGAHLFDPGSGRPMKEWVAVPAAHSAHWPALADYARTYVADLSTRA